MMALVPGENDPNVEVGVDNGYLFRGASSLRIGCNAKGHRDGIIQQKAQKA